MNIYNQIDNNKFIIKYVFLSYAFGIVLYVYIILYILN